MELPCLQMSRLEISSKQGLDMWLMPWSRPYYCPRDMANLRSMRKHEVFLSLKRGLALVSSLITPLPSLFFFLILILIFVFPNLHISSSLKGCPIPAYGRGDSEQLLSNDEGRGGQTHCCHGGFQGGREESLRTDH